MQGYSYYGELGWSFVYLGPIGLGNGPHVLGNGPHLLGNGPHLCTHSRIGLFLLWGG